MKENAAGVFALDDNKKTRAVFGTSSTGMPSVELLDNQETRPGGRGKFEVRITPLGRAVVERQWVEQPWKELA